MAKVRDPHEPCRLCMGRSDGIAIFPKSCDGSELMQRIGYSVGIKVKLTDSRLTLCKECTDKVNATYEFKLMCQKTEKEIGASYNPNPSDDCTVSPVKIKQEPDEVFSPTVVQCKSESDTKNECQKIQSLSPSKPDQSWPKLSKGLVVYATVNESGQLVPMPTMLPLGGPIPLDSLNMGMIPPFFLPQGTNTSVLSNQIVKSSNGVVGMNPLFMPQSLKEPAPLLKPKPEPMSDDEANTKTATVSDTQSELSQVNTATEKSVPTSEAAEAASSDDDADLEDLLKQVHTDSEGNDEEKENTNAASATSSSKAGPKSSKEATANLNNGTHGKEGEEADETATSLLFPKTSKRKREEDSSVSLTNSNRTIRRRGRRPKGITQSVSPPPVTRPKRSCAAKKKKLVEVDSEEEEGEISDDNDPPFMLNDVNDKSPTSSSDPDEPDEVTTNTTQQEEKGHSPAKVLEAKTSSPEKNDEKPKLAEGFKPTTTYTGTLRCKECPRIFRSEIYLKCHERTHQTIERFMCVKCEEQFTTRSDLERHEDTNHINETWECQPCFVAFAQIKTWRAHVKRHKVYPRQVHIKVSDLDQKDVKVEEPKPSVSEETEQKAGQKDGDVKTTGNTPVPEKKSDTKQKGSGEASTLSEEEDDPAPLEETDKSTTKTKKYTCSVCNLALVDEKTLSLHMKVHLKPKGPPYSCRYCQKEFKDKGALICHETEHKPTFEKKPKTFKCRFCDKVFKTLSDKICHEEISHRK